MSKNVVLGQIIIFAQTVFAQTAARDQLCGGNSTLSEKIDGCELLESTYWRASQPVCFATHPTAEDPGGSKCILESNKMKICVTFFLFQSLATTEQNHQDHYHHHLIPRHQENGPGGKKLIPFDVSKYLSPP